MEYKCSKDCVSYAVCNHRIIEGVEEGGDCPEVSEKEVMKECWTS